MEFTVVLSRAAFFLIFAVYFDTLLSFCRQCWCEVILCFRQSLLVCPFFHKYIETCQNRKPDINGKVKISGRLEVVFMIKCLSTGFPQKVLKSFEVHNFVFQTWKKYGKLE